MFIKATGTRQPIRGYPAAAAERGIGPGHWVRVKTPDGGVRARGRFNYSLRPNVACGQTGWWQASPENSAPGYDPFSPDGANRNLLIGNEAIDPVSGAVPRLYLPDSPRRMSRHLFKSAADSSPRNGLRGRRGAREVNEASWDGWAGSPARIPAAHLADALQYGLRVVS